MGYGIIDIWVRWAKDCRPAERIGQERIKWQVSVRYCCPGSPPSPRGYIASGNVEGVEGEDDPPQGIGKWVPKRCLNITPSENAHVMVKVPPGCYIVDAWEKGTMRYNAHETMVVVSCGERACVNLLAGDRGSDFVPLVIQALAANIDPGSMVNTALQTLRNSPQQVTMPLEQFNCLLETLEPSDEFPKIRDQITALRPLLTGEDPPQIDVPK